jgi:hypothetical protein
MNQTRRSLCTVKEVNDENDNGNSVREEDLVGMTQGSGRDVTFINQWRYFTSVDGKSKSVLLNLFLFYECICSAIFTSFSYLNHF